MYCLRQAYKRGLAKYLNGAIMVVVRVRRDGSTGCAKPCEHCTPVLGKLSLTVYYSP